MYFIAASDQRTMGVVPAFGLKAWKIIFVVLLNPFKCELAAPLPIDSLEKWKARASGKGHASVRAVALSYEQRSKQVLFCFPSPMPMDEWKLFQPGKLSSTSASWSSCSRNKSIELPGHKMLCLPKGKSKRGIYHDKNFQESTLDLIIRICLTLDLIPPKSGLGYP